MVIVSGKIFVPEEQRDEFVATSLDAVRQARETDGCLDFVVAADPLEPGRVNVYERWETEEALEAFRGEGPSGEMTAQILDADVARHRISSSGPA